MTSQENGRGDSDGPRGDAFALTSAGIELHFIFGVVVQDVEVRADVS